MKIYVLLVFLLLASAATAASAQADNSNLELKAGWNLISSPVEDGIPSEKFSAQCKIKSGPWIWDAGLGNYVQTKNLQPYVGTWVKVEKDCSVSFFDTKIKTMKDLLLKKSWNLISGIGQLSDFGGCAIKSGPWEYNTSKKNYVKTDVFNPDKGYWIKVKSDCVLAEKK